LATRNSGTDWDDSRSSEQMPAGKRLSRNAPFDLETAEVQVLKYLAEGLTDKDIAATLQTNERTVKTRVGDVLRKTSSLSRTEAVIKAIKQGLIFSAALLVSMCPEVAF